MKKLLSVVVVFVMIVAMSVTAFAADPTTTLVEGKWTTAGSDAAYANSMMTVVAISGSTISVDSIQYIDQATADANGAYSFAGYLPKEDPEQNEEYLVFVGGQKLANPIPAGKITYVAPPVTDVTVTGVVGNVGENTGATVALYNGEDLVVSTTADLKDGDFSITAPAGTYTLKITKPGHTKYIYNNVDISTLTAGATYTLYAGNANGDEGVGLSDITTVIGNLYKTITPDIINSDVNDDGGIGLSDITTVIGNLYNNDVELPQA